MTLSETFKRDGALLEWARPFSRQINLDPARFGLPPGRAESYRLILDRYETALWLTANPNLRRRIDTLEKLSAKHALAAESRALVDAIEAWPGLDDAKRSELGIPIRGRSARRVPPPAARPVVQLVRQTMRGLTVRLLTEGESTGRGRIPGVAGAIVMTFVGDVPPSDSGEWAFRGNTRRMSMDLDFPASVPPGSKVWVTAVFFNNRLENGPPSRPLGMHIAGGEGLSRAA